jgi:hypothetical protein
MSVGSGTKRSWHWAEFGSAGSVILGSTRIGWLFAHSRGATRALVMLVLLAVVTAKVPRNAYEVPGMAGRAVVLPMVMLGSAGLIAGAGFVRPSLELEGSAPRRLWAMRLAWAFALGLAAGMIFGLALGIRLVPEWYLNSWTWILWRNVALSLGFGLLCAIRMPASIAALPLLAILGVTVMYGTVDYSGTAHWWAILVQPATLTNVGIAGLIAAAGVAAYAGWDTHARPVSDDR